MNYLKQNHLSLLVLLLILGSWFIQGDGEVAVGNTVDVTAITNPWVFNEDSEDINYRFESDSDANFAFFDAGLSRIGLGTSTPDVLLDVDGGIDAVSYGDGIFSTSTTGTLTEAQLLHNGGIYITATGVGQDTLSLTLPATSTMTTLINEVGSCRSWFVDASDVAAGTTTTFVLGTGMDLVGLDATGAGTGADVIDGAEFGTIQMCRATDDDVVVYIEEWIAAD